MAEHLELEAAIRKYRALLIDTNLLIHEFKGDVQVIAQIPPAQRVTSPVAVWEFVHLEGGQMIAHAERVERRGWMNDQQIESEWFWPGTENSFHTLLWHTNSPTGVVDCLLAAESISRKWPLVTRNLKHFDDVPGIFLVPY